MNTFFDDTNDTSYTTPDKWDSKLVEILMDAMPKYTDSEIQQLFSRAHKGTISKEMQIALVRLWLEQKTWLSRLLLVLQKVEDAHIYLNDVARVLEYYWYGTTDQKVINAAKHYLDRLGKG